MNGHDEKALLRVAEAAALLSVSERTAYELIAAGRLRKVRLNSMTRIPRAAIDELVRDLEREQAADDETTAALRRRLRSVR